MRIVIFLGLWLAALSVHSAPQKALLEGWGLRDNNSKVTIDHSLWQWVLEKYVSEKQGRTVFDYRSVNQVDQQKLNDYITILESINPLQLNSVEQKAYWLNLYNALTVRLVLEAYPVSSIKKIKGGLFNSGPWDAKVITINGQSLSLNNIEHGILRPVFNDPLIHYGVNCASVGCPNLLKQAFTSKNVDGLLEMAAKAFINHPRGVRVEGNTLHLSSIYEWFAEDFQPSVIEHILQYAEPNLAASIRAIPKPSLDYDYDWSLNEP